MNLGGPELLILIAVVVLVFGAGWLPKAARNLGKAKVELDKAQQQFNEAKDQVVEATGVKELESTVRKANKVLNTTPQGLIKGAAASAIKPTKSGSTSESEAEKIEDAEIVPEDDTPSDEPATNLNVDFSD